MTAYDPSVHRTVVAGNGEASRKFHSINKLLIDMDAAGMIQVSAQDLPPSDTTVVWLDLTIPEDGNGQAKVYDSGSWVPLTPEFFALHYGASTAAAQAAAAAAEASATAAEGFKDQTQSDAAATAADVITADAAKVAAVAAQAAAEQARDEAETAADNFDDLYLGTKAIDPTVDNDGDPLVKGQMYFNSGSDELRIYNGASWQAYSAASGLTAVVDDTSPKLGGNLDLNGNVINGLEIGTDVQAQSANLDSWSMAVPSDYLTTTAAAAAYQPLAAALTSLASASANGVSLVTAANYAAMRALLDLEAGTDFYSISAANAAFQPLDSDLTTWAGVTPGTGVATALAIAIGSAGALVANGGALGTPSGGTLTNCSSLPAAGVSGTALVLGTEDQGPIAGGASVTKKSLGSGTGTITVDVSDRPTQTIANDTGAFTLDVGTSHEGSTVVIITNGASAGAITTSGFNVVKGDAFTTTNTHKFRCVVEYWGSGNKWLFIERVA